MSGCKVAPFAPKIAAFSLKKAHFIEKLRFSGCFVLILESSKQATYTREGVIIMQSVIEVENLEKLYKNKQALKKISFQVRHGEIFGFLGPSGSGKTTTVKILTSQLLYTSGRVKVLGIDPGRSRPSEFLSKIGVLTDNSGIYERLSVYENLELFCRLYSVPERRIETVLEAVNLAENKHTQVGQLSKGMKQRVTLARTILHEPDILFLDEPTSALDPMNSGRIQETLREMNRKGTTIFLTTHNMQEAEELCDRVAFLNNGEISALDTPQALRLQYSDGSITVTTRQGKQLVQRNETGADLIKALMVSDNLLAIHSNEPTLGDIFVKLTGRGLE